jgi:hypothetical protein
MCSNLLALRKGFTSVQRKVIIDPSWPGRETSGFLFSRSDGIMNFRIDHYFHFDAAQQSQLDRIEAALATITQQEQAMTPQLQALQAEVQRNTDVTTSVTALVQNLADQIVALKDDPAALQALADSLKANDDGLAAAVTANTPAAPAP